MPTPVTAARACLSPDASAALDAAVSTARRRSHAQTTSLHLISSLLSGSLLREALQRSRSTAYSSRLQFKALDLCFSVALDRLPSCSSSSSSAAIPLDEPPVSNSLMAAIKRSQANQRRNPDTFHLYQQQSQSCASSSSFSGVKVELQQLILAILDDPVVSRVFGEAGFRSSDIKLAILRPAPSPMLRFPRRCPPLFLCSFSNGSDELIGSVASSGDEHCRTIGEILSRDSSNGRNPMLVGADAGDVARDFVGAVNRRNWSLFPPEVEGIRIFNVRLDEADRIEDVVNGFGNLPGPGVVLSVGDLNDLLEGEKARRVVSEVTRVLELKRGRVWVMGWTVDYEIYMDFLGKYPLIDKDWDLTILPTTTPSTRASGTNNGCLNKAHSFVPFGGFFPETFEPMGTGNSLYQQSGTRCQSCNYNYEQEAMTILKASSMETGDHVHSNLPSWLSRSNSGAFPSGFGETAKASDDSKLVLNGKIANLQKKWTDYCHRLHTTYSQRMVAPEKNYALYPSFVPVTQNPAIMPLPKPNYHTQSISLPLTKPRDEDLISKFQPRHSKSEQLHLRESEGHASPSSATSVTTDLALATPRGLPPEKTESPKARLPFQVNPSANPIVASPNPAIPDLTSYKSFFADLFKRVGRQEEALKHISAVVSSIKANPNSIPSLSRRGIWLGFQGGDRRAQKKVAIALTEMLSGRKDNLVSVDLSKCFNARNHGKTSIDYVAGEIAKIPSAVVYIENVDKADILEQSSLDNAVTNGKLRDSNKREIGIGGRIFLLSSRRKDILSSTKECSSFAEENILSAQGRKMKILMESPNAAVRSVSSRRVVLTQRCESQKRKSDTSYGSPKRPYLGLDLNLPIEESKDEPESNSLSEDDSDTWVEDLFQKLDQTVEFSSFNYNALADEVLWKVNRIFCEKFGSAGCHLEIEIDAMEQILAVEERGVIFEWVEMVLGASFGELKQRCSRVSGSTLFRLVAREEDPLMEGEKSPGSVLLPSKIIIN